jgi:multiple sugar transport system ATP-binding protein
MKSPGFKALFGPSGVGKTSLAKIIARGNFKFDGDIVTENIDTILYSYNLERLPGWSSTGNHLNKVTPPEKQLLKEQLIGIFELNDVLDSRFSKLSMGQQNRMNLIRYLLQDFDLLILDESLANVDEKLRETIILAIKELFADKIFLYISHNLMEVSKFCGQILVFGKSSENKGCLMIDGQDCKRDYHLDKKKLDITMLEIMNAF